MLKLNPVNDYLNPVFRKVFYEFIQKGYITVVNGDIPAPKTNVTLPVSFPNL